MVTARRTPRHPIVVVSDGGIVSINKSGTPSRLSSRNGTPRPIEANKFEKKRLSKKNKRPHSILGHDEKSFEGLESLSVSVQEGEISKLGQDYMHIDSDRDKRNEY